MGFGLWSLESGGLESINTSRTDRLQGSARRCRHEDNQLYSILAPLRVSMPHGESLVYSVSKMPKGLCRVNKLVVSEGGHKHRVSIHGESVLALGQHQTYSVCSTE